jgi:transcriptional regulator with PAS, ATPase and Fis domain
MFGYVKGAFTGADNKDKRGLFEMANGGTILLDEISEMPLKLQPKILRVLQEREFTRVGGTENIRIDVRVIASTNKNLIDLIRENLFRVDLYYRLNVFPINMPPLRERIEDIPDFVANFLLKFNLLYGKEKAFSHEAIRSLMSYAWPGNVRELENIVERLAVISTNAMLTREDVEGVMGMGGNHVGDAREHVAGQGLKESVREFERRIISRAISDYGDSYSAARALKTTQPTIVRKAQALGIPLKRGKSKN